MGTTLKSMGTTLKYMGTTLKYMGTTLKSMGTTLKSMGTTLKSMGTTLKSMGTTLKSNQINRGKINTPNIQKHNMVTHSPGLVQTLRYKSDRVKLDLWTRTSPLIEMKWSCKCLPHVRKLHMHILSCI